MKLSDLNQKAQLEAYFSKVQTTQESQNQQHMQQKVNQNPGQPQPSDRVELSSGSRLLQKVNEALKLADPERAEKVNFLKEQVREGNYERDAVKIANGMMKDLLKELG
jgi:flagellar biosynthesis anti-sigma factor FlgM